MTIKLRDETGVLRTIQRIRFRDSTGVLRTIQSVKMRDDTATLRTVFTYLTAAASPVNTTGANSGTAASGDVTTATITVTPTGGASPYTYAWEYISGNVSIAPNTPTSASTTFTLVGAFDGISYTAVYRCKVTDANGAVAYTNNVDIRIYWLRTL